MMNTQVLVCFMLFLGVCDYCKNEFDHVNKLKWRCKARFDQSNHSKNVQNQDALPVTVNNISRSTDLISCICGKQCKGLEGLLHFLKKRKHEKLGVSEMKKKFFSISNGLYF